MKSSRVLVRATVPVSFRSACDIRRACRPMWLSPISPSSSALGTSAATGIHHHHIDTSGPDQRSSDLERLFAVIWLRDDQIVDIHAKIACISRIQSMLGINESGGAARFLRLSDHLQGQRGLAG